MTLIAATLLSLFALGCTSPSNDEEAAEKAPQKIAINGNLPLTGPIAAFSGQYPLGFGLGLESPPPGLAFETDFQDNAGDPTTAVTVLQRQLLDPPDVYISGTTQMTEPLLPQLEKAEIPHFLVSFDAFMTRDNPGTFRLLPNFKIEAPLFIDFISSKEAKKVFFFTPNLKAYIEQSDQLILPPLAAQGIEVERELFDFGHQDFRPLAAKAKAFDPDVIVVSGYSFQVQPILRALSENGLNTQSEVVVTLDFIDLLHGDTPRDELVGYTFVSPVCEIPGSVDGYSEWASEFEKKYNKRPSYVDAYAYDTARVVVAAAKAGPITEQSIMAQMPFDGVVGQIMLDDSRDLSSTLVLAEVGEDGQVRRALERTTAP